MGIRWVFGFFLAMTTMGVAQEPVWVAPIDADSPIRVDVETGKSLVVRSLPCESLKPASLYRFEFHARRPEGSGSVVAGPECVNQDYTEVGADWAWYSHIFRTPDNLGGSVAIRIGLWEGSGYVECDAMRITEAVPIRARLAMGMAETGESIDADGYHFRTDLGGDGMNYHRLLRFSNTSFNSNRWCFGGNSEVIYTIPDAKAEVSVTVNYHTSGTCIVETTTMASEVEVPEDAAGWDALEWKPLGEIGTVDTATFSLDAESKDAGPMVRFLRLRGSGDAGFQVNRLSVDVPSSEWYAKILSQNGSPTRLVGRTIFGSVAFSDAAAAKLHYTVCWDRQMEPGYVRLVMNWEPKNHTSAFKTESALIEEIPDGELHEAVAKFADGLITLKTTLRTPTYYRTDYGMGLTSDGSADVWWCDATQKIPKGRKAPVVADTADAMDKTVTMAACRGDREAAQIVVQPKPASSKESSVESDEGSKESAERIFTGMTATIGDLVGKNDSNAKITADRVSLNWVRYHWVEEPTDSTCVRDWWPDALIPMRPIDGNTNENQPLWVEIAVPYGIPADTYTGTVTLTANSDGDDWNVKIPIQIQVWNIDLPETPRLESGYGISPEWIAAYHNLTEVSDKRAVFNEYLQALSESRICVYDPVPYDSFTVKYIVDGENSRAVFDFSKWDAAMEQVIEKYHIANFKLPIHGMGGGTFYSRNEPKLEGFGEDTPEYQAMFKSYVTQLQAHLVEKGWIDMAYVYWFDEPEPKDYEFVQKGMERIKKYAPRIRTMLTEEPGSPEFADCVDLWCPISNMFNQEKADVQMAKNQKFWWYVCCGPKAPYCTEFTDHPATELRTWFWQAWQRKITGSLIWHTTWWTSDTAFPDGFQDPYADPMCYTSGYGIAPGTKAFWGNGDGRFLYPPEECNVPGSAKDSGGNPIAVLKPPVKSIRLAMIREGGEDYELLLILQDRITAAKERIAAGKSIAVSEADLAKYEELLMVPSEITTDMTHFTKTSAPIYARRAAIAAAIEAMGP